MTKLEPSLCSVRRLIGMHFNYCPMENYRGSHQPPACKMPALSALLEWHALYTESMLNETVLCV